MTLTNVPLAVVVKGWPRLSETFIAQELKALEDAGQRFDIWSCCAIRPTGSAIPCTMRSSGQGPLPAGVSISRTPACAAECSARRATCPALLQSPSGIWRRDLARDLSPNRIRRFGQACVLAPELPAGTLALYAHFLHTPSSVARYAAIHAWPALGIFGTRQGYLDHPRLEKSVKS